MFIILLYFIFVIEKQTYFIFCIFSGALNGLYSQILSGEEGIRERCLKFLSTKLKSLGHEVVNKEAEDFLVAETKKVLQVSCFIL